MARSGMTTALRWLRSGGCGRPRSISGSTLPWYFTTRAIEAERAIRENFAAGHFLGVPVLEWAGLTTAAAYPAMSCWLRDELGIPHLRRFWSGPEDTDWVAANTLLCGLGIGLRETFDYLLR